MSSQGKEIIAISCAKENGLTFYFTGNPCRNGHISERYVNNRGCVECYRIAQKQPEKKAYFKKYYSENCETIKNNVRVYRENNPEVNKRSKNKRIDKVRAYDRMRAKRDYDKKKLIVANWKKNNPERYKELAVVRSIRRRARKRDAGGDWTRNDITKMKKDQKNKCWWCGVELTKGYHVDHRIPLSKGGSNAISNLVVSCPTCNFHKAAKMPWEFMERLL